MKKITLLAVAALAISFASCKKDRTCTCTSTSSAGGSNSTTNVTTIVKSSKAQGKANCVSTKTTNNGVTNTNDCKLS